jgi:hypothetical protein
MLVAVVLVVIRMAVTVGIDNCAHFFLLEI